MRRARSLAAVLAVLAIAAPAGAQETPTLEAGSARGSYVIEGRRCEAVAVLGTLTYDLFDETKASARLLFATKPFDDANRKLLPFQRMRASGAPFELEMTVAFVRSTGKAEAEFMTIYDADMVHTGGGGMRVELERYSDTSLKGRAFTEKVQSLGGTKYECDLAFDVDLEVLNHPPVSSSTGTRLPADGGAPGAAYVAAKRELLAAKTYEEMYTVSTRVMSSTRGPYTSPAELEAQRSSIPQYAAPEKRDEYMRRCYELSRLLFPSRVPTVTGGHVDGDRATLTVRWIEDRIEMDGRVNMHREGGVWKLGYESSMNRQ